jgi:hypothetical protein
MSRRKTAPRTTRKPTRTVWRDTLSQATLVVQEGPQLFMVPNCRGGWSRRIPINLEQHDRETRLRPADVDIAWLEGSA